ncbi:MAG TPA: 3-oxoacyl-ACP reductase family protein [Solirubrobacteraceae bacterium]|jgi:acetoacetyl-CoA reductase/3-oxoacyl-[acyl-carrier protein] reductase
MSATEAKAPHAAGTGPRKLEGRVALVTGGTRGIGAAIARDLGAQGAVVAAGFSSNREKADEFLAGLGRDGIKGSLHQGNVGDWDDCQKTIHDVIEQHGRLDILVNNAGITADRPVMKMTAEDWHKVLRVNLSGAFYLSKPALEHMVERGTGRIVNISSIIGQMGNIGQANYAASKSGLFGLTMTMAREAAHALGKAGKLHEGGPALTVNAVAPGFIETDMLATVPDKVLDKIRAQVPLGRLGRPEDISRMVEFLCEDEASYITGQVFAVNGGMEM